MKMPEPTMPPITSIVASNNPRRAARVGPGSGGDCVESAFASRDGFLSGKNKRARQERRDSRQHAARIYHRYRHEPSVARVAESELDRWISFICGCDLWVTVTCRNSLRPSFVRRIPFLGCVWVWRGFSPGLGGGTSADCFERRERK